MLHDVARKRRNSAGAHRRQAIQGADVARPPIRQGLTAEVAEIAKGASRHCIRNDRRGDVFLRSALSNTTAILSDLRGLGG
jgi:hypothetical protein